MERQNGEVLHGSRMRHSGWGVKIERIRFEGGGRGEEREIMERGEQEREKEKAIQNREEQKWELQNREKRRRE